MTSIGKGWDAFATPVPGNVPAALSELGIEVLRESGDELIALCPQHLARTGKQDRHPSWSVNADSGVHNCFACGYKGPFVTLVADQLQLDRPAAVAWVRARGGIERVRKILDPIVPPAAKDTTREVNEASLALMDLPPKKEMARRRLSFDAVKKHGVLWDPRKRCWILPIRDPDTGRLWGWQEKSAHHFRNRPSGVPKAKTLFGLDVFTGQQAILVESPLDVVRLTSVGIAGGLATFGAAVSDHQMKLVQTVVDHVIVAMDNPAVDTAGAQSAQSLLQNWARRGMTLHFLNYGQSTCKDVGEMDDDEIRHAVATARSSVRTRFPHADRKPAPLPRRGRR